MRLYPDLRLHAARYSGLVTLAEMQRVQTEIQKQKLSPGPRLGFLDLDAVTDIEAGYAEVLEIRIALLRNLRKNRHTLRLSCLATTHLGYGMSRMFVQLLYGSGYATGHVSDTRDEALDWLLLPSVPMELRHPPG